MVLSFEIVKISSQHAKKKAYHKPTYQLSAYPFNISHIYTYNT